jgi:hypothetical protein
MLVAILLAAPTTGSFPEGHLATASLGTSTALSMATHATERATGRTLPPTGRSSSASPRSPRPTTAPPDLVLNGSTVLNISHNLTVGNLTVENSAALEFGNASWSATLTIDGTILLLGHGRLEVWDAYVVIEGTYNGERTAYLYDNSSIDLESALVTSDYYSWGAELYGNSNVTLVGSSLGSWCILDLRDSSSAFALSSEVDADTQVSDSAHVVLVDSAGMHVWLEFGYGSGGNVSLPPTDVSTNWTFPVPGTTWGVDTGVRLVDSSVGLYAVSVDDGANVTLVNSTNLDLSLVFYENTVRAAGLHEGLYTNFTFPSTTTRLHLVNVSVLSWSLYPVASTVTVSDSQLGEVIGWESSTLLLENSNLTGTGGVYGGFDTTNLTISNCTVRGEVVGWNSSRIELTNSTVVDSGAQSVLAVDNATIVASNDTLAAGVTYTAQDGGQIDVLVTVLVTTLIDDEPTGGVRVFVPGAANGTLSAADGRAVLSLETEIVLASGPVPAAPYIVDAVDGLEVGEMTGSITGLTSWAISLSPFVAAVSPIDGSIDVATDATVTILFALPMITAGTTITLTPEPHGAYVDWVSTQALTIEASWAPSTEYSITLGGAVTQGGIAILATFSTSFTSASAPSLVEVSGTSPSNGSSSVRLNSVVEVNFTVPMDPASTALAFTVSPSTASSGPVVEGDVLVWEPTGLLQPGTTYSVTIGSSAESADLLPLNAPDEFSFSTVPASSVPHVVSWNPANGSVVRGPLSELTVNWTLPMDAASVAAAFHVTPDLPGTLRVNGTETVWKPAVPVSNETAVLIEFGPSAESSAGEVLLGPVWGSFTVAGPNSTTAPASATMPGLTTPVVLVIVGIAAVGWVVVAVLLGRRARPPPPVVASPTRPEWSETDRPPDSPSLR